MDLWGPAAFGTTKQELCMAYYLVKYKGNTYANRELVKRMYNVGDSGMIGMVVSQKIPTKAMLDAVVYRVDQSQIPSRLACHVRMQNIDDQMCQFRRSKDAKDKFVVASSCTVWDMDGISFVRLMDLPDTSSRYRWAHSMPHIQFLGKKYIAIGMELKDKGCLVAVLE